MMKGHCPKRGSDQGAMDQGLVTLGATEGMLEEGAWFMGIRVSSKF